MFEWYADLPRWLKFGVAFVILGISAAMWTGGLFWPWGWGVGFVLLIAAFTIDE